MRDRWLLRVIVVGLIGMGLTSEILCVLLHVWGFSHDSQMCLLTGIVIGTLAGMAVPLRHERPGGTV